MKMHLICPMCTDFKNPATAIRTMVQVQLEESGLYTLTCSVGHTTVFRLQEMKFEILFDVGLHAILDGYYREAVSAFASSLERFFEFYIELQCYRLGIDEQVYYKAWKDVSSQSERQLGAFVFMYLTEMKQSPQLLTNDAVKFRNAVVHKGRFPDESEAVGFGKEVYGIAKPILSRLLSEQSEDVRKMVVRHLKRTDNGRDFRSINPITIPTLLSISRPDAPGFDEWMGILEAGRRGPFSNAPVFRKSR